MTQMQSDPPGLARLKKAIKRAEIEMQAVPAGETMFPLAEYVDDQDRRAKWRVVSEIRFREKLSITASATSRSLRTR
jgi:hypothetical protein